MFTMRHTRRWLGAGSLLLSGLGLGCSHHCCNNGCAPCDAKCAAVVSAQPAAGTAMTTKLPIDSLPSVSRERYIVPERPQSDVVTSLKPDESLVKQAVQPLERHNDGRRSFPDITARGGFAHAANYSWLVGELHFSAQKGQWRLRYAAIDDEDRYGGGVTLDAAQHQMKDLQDGMMVRVEGSLADPEARDPAPVYRVRDIAPVGK
ncbi:MAG: hypothetical protein ACJ8F7_03130 [Gemmataceae bacterium]